MKLLVGLGNPGEKYEGTRHNAGFMFLDRLVCAKELAPAGECIALSHDKKFDAEIGETLFEGEKLVFIKPQTYMNLSGEAVRKIMEYHKAEAKDLLVISDDIDLPVGMVRVRKEGSSGGQKGLQSIIDHIKSNEFIRIRIGIRTAEDSETSANKFDAVNFVLGKFTDREKPLVDLSIGEAVEYILPYLGRAEEVPSHSFEVKGLPGE